MHVIFDLSLPMEGKEAYAATRVKTACLDPLSTGAVQQIWSKTVNSRCGIAFLPQFRGSTVIKDDWLETPTNACTYIIHSSTHKDATMHT